MALKTSETSKTSREVAPMIGSGIQLTVTVLAFGAIGWWLDGEFGTRPWLLLGGFVFGAVGGMISFIRTALKSGGSGPRRTPSATTNDDQQDRKDEQTA